MMACRALMVVASILGAGVFSSVLAADDTDPVARDLLILTDWFEGEFDNEEQVWFQADPRSATPERDRQIRIHVAHRRLNNLPQLGEHVFYVEEYKDNDPTETIRQRLVIFSSDGSANSIRMQQGFFKAPEQILGAHNSPGKLDDLKTEDVRFLPECDVFWQRVADQYEGAMRPKACVFGEANERRYAVHNLILSANKYWRVDSTFLISDNSLHVGYPVDKPIRMRRAKIFLCEATFRSDGREPQSIGNLKLHSQGGEAHLSRQTDGAEFSLRLRDKEYPYYNTRPDFLYFSFREKGGQRSIVYTVNDSNSRRIGFSTPQFSAHCHREGYNFREPIEEL